MKPFCDLSLLRAGAIMAAALVAVPALGVTDRNGYYWVTDYAGVDETGVNDSTNGIQNAINDAIDNSRVLYFPLGTYKISDTIIAKQLPKNPTANCSGQEWDAFNAVMIGEVGSNGERPLIRLANGSSGFNNTSNPKEMIYFVFEKPNGDERANCAFANGFRNIDLDVGNNNAGAIAMHAGGAQENFLENVHIDATGGYIGIRTFPGRGASARNITIVGGQIGIDADDDKGGGTGGHLNHITFRNQTQAAIIDGVGRGFSAIGLDIEMASGPAIITNYQGETDGHIGFYDCRIEFTGSGGTVVDNTDDVTIVMKNVYVKGASQLIDNPVAGDDVSLNPGSWTRINDYAHNTGKGTQGQKIINGTRTTSDLSADLDTNTAPPSDYRDNHFWAGPPDYRASGVINAITASGGDVDPFDSQDDAPGLQDLIDNHDVIFLPRGIYRLDSPITLRANTVLFGVPGRKTVLEPTFDQADTFVLNTVNDANATTVLSDVTFGNQPGTGTSAGAQWNTGAIHWRAGRDSVVAYTRDIVGHNQRYEQAAREIFKVSGNGGGRWYGLVDHAFSSTTQDANSNFRKLLVTGTTEPLTFYGPNPEHGGSASNKNGHSYFIEINNASNVRLFGIKIEGFGELIRVKDSENVLVSTGYVKPENINSPLVTVDGGDQVEVHLLGWPRSDGANSGNLLLELNNGSSDTIHKGQSLSYFRRGPSLDWSVWNDVGEGSGSGGGNGGNAAPTVATAAAADPNPVVNASSTDLSVLGADDDGESNLSYTWSTTSKPSGAANPTFSVNGTNAAKNTTATFSADGSYTLRATISDGSLSVNSSVSVSVTLPSGGGGGDAFTSTEAAEVREANPTSNYGGASDLTVGGASGFQKESLIKFNVSGLSGTVSDATLRITVTTAPTGGSTSVYSGSTSWAEGSVTWNTRPSLGTLVTTFSNPTSTGTIDVDVTSAVSGNGTYSFHLSSGDNDVIKYGSDDTGTPPQLIVETGSSGGGNPTTVTYDITASADDGEEGFSTPNATSGDLELGSKWVGLRFTDVAVPQGATITSATVTFQEESGVQSTASATIYGEDVNNAADYASGAQPSARTRTTASVTWSNISSVNNVDTPDLASLIQEIVDRSGWASGNDLGLLFSNGGGRADASSYDDDPARAPVLEITYE